MKGSRFSKKCDIQRIVSGYMMVELLHAKDFRHYGITFPIAWNDNNSNIEAFREGFFFNQSQCLGGRGKVKSLAIELDKYESN